MLDFNSNIKKFYAAEKHTFLAKNAATPGDKKTFYLHFLQFYFPKIAQKKDEENYFGVGIFTMQRFKKRKKESKKMFKQFQNGKGNVLVTNINRLYNLLFHNSST